MRLHRAIAIVAFIALGSASASAEGGLIGAFAASTWQGAWGVEGMTPVVTFAGSAVTYEGADRSTFAVTDVAITSAKVTFQVGTAAVTMTKRTDANADMISTIGENSSPPILLCKSTAAHCP